MDKNPLVETQILGGERLLAELDKKDAQITTAFWFFDIDRGWLLVLSSAKFDMRGQIKSYEKVLNVIKKLGSEINISPTAVAIYPHDHPLVRSFRTLFKTQPKGMGRIEVQNSTFGNLFLRHVLIYRSS